MDKTGWIVVTLCAGLLGLQMYYNSTDEQQPAAPATPAAATAPADNTATAPAADKKVIATLTSKDAEGKPVARYNFSNIGGSISNVEMLGQVINSTREELKNTDVRINSNPDAGIGNLVFGLSNDRAPQFDQAVYEYRADLSNDNQVTLLGRVGLYMFCFQIFHDISIFHLEQQVLVQIQINHVDVQIMQYQHLIDLIIL